MSTLMEISQAGSAGLNKDVDDFSLDTAVWTVAMNVSFDDNRAVTIGGREEAFTTTADPWFLLSYTDGEAIFWIWAGQTKIHYNQQGDNVDISGPSAPYNAQSPADWNGALFNGFAIINSGRDVPQYWSGTDMPTVLDLPNWPAGFVARNIGVMGPRLVAINLTETTALRPHKVLWSHPADPGTLPVSWDIADPTKTAGEYELPDIHNGVLVDQLTLRGQNYLYKEEATWRMTLRGDQFVFNFDTFLDTSGILAPRCVAVTGDGLRHLVVTTDDIIAHDGVNATSIFDKKFRRYFFSQLSIAHRDQTFVFCDPANKKMWICYVLEGETAPTRAVLWDYVTGAISETEINFQCAGQGVYELPDPDTWATVVGTWATIARDWSSVVRKAVLVGADNKALRLNVGNTFDGVAPTVTLQRTGLSLQGTQRDKTPLSDLTQRMMIVRVWPRIKGGPVSIRIGAQDTPQSAIRWSSYASFDPSSAKFVDLIAEGGLPAIEFKSQADLAWQLEGYKLDGALTGRY